MIMLKFAGRCPICRGWPVLTDYAGGWAAGCPQGSFEDLLKGKPNCAFSMEIDLFPSPNEAVEEWNRKVLCKPKTCKKE